jgi:hypothetical protein
LTKEFHRSKLQAQVARPSANATWVYLAPLRLGEILNELLVPGDLVNQVAALSKLAKAVLHDLDTSRRSKQYYAPQNLGNMI